MKLLGKKIYFKVQKELGTLMWFIGFCWAVLRVCSNKWELNDLVAPLKIGREYLNYSRCWIMKLKPFRKWSAELVAIIWEISWKGGEPSRKRIFFQRKNSKPSSAFIHTNVCSILCLFRKLMYCSNWWMLNKTHTEYFSLSLSGPPVSMTSANVSVTARQR